MIIDNFIDNKLNEGWGLKIFGGLILTFLFYLAKMDYVSRSDISYLKKILLSKNGDEPSSRYYEQVKKDKDFILVVKYGDGFVGVYIGEHINLLSETLSRKYKIDKEKIKELAEELVSGLAEDISYVPMDDMEELKELINNKRLLTEMRAKIKLIIKEANRILDSGFSKLEKFFNLLINEEQNPQAKEKLIQIRNRYFMHIRDALNAKNK